jgi:hypothetical protein
MLEAALDAQRRRAGNNVAKRRRMNGSLEEDVPPSGSAPATFAAPDGSPGANAADFAGPEQPEQTEVVSRPPPRMPPGPSASAAQDEPLARSESSTRKAPPQAIPIGNPSLAAAEGLAMTPLEMRIRRLEDALAQLQAMRGTESRITTSQPARPVPVATPAPAHQAPTDKLWDLGKRVLSTPVEVARNLGTPPGAMSNRLGWLALESIAEARAIFRMFSDPRYRLTWTTRIAPPVLIALIVLSWWWIPFTSVPFLGLVLNKSIDLVLAFVLFKLLGHEARRYRETAPDLPPSLRL